MDEERLLTRKQVSELVALQKSEIYKQMQSERFPVPLRVGAKAVRWKMSEILTWLDSRERAQPATTH